MVEQEEQQKGNPWHGFLSALETLSNLPEGASLAVLREKDQDILTIQSTTHFLGLRGLCRYWFGDSRVRTTNVLESMTNEIEKAVDRLVAELTAPHRYHNVTHFITWTQVADFGQDKLSLKMIVEQIEKSLPRLERMNKDQYKEKYEPMNRVCQRLKEVRAKGRVTLDELTKQNTLRLTLTSAHCK